MTEKEPLPQRRGFNSEKLMKEFFGDNPGDELRRLYEEENLNSKEIAKSLQKQFPEKRAPSHVTIWKWLHKLDIPLKFEIKSKRS